MNFLWKKMVEYLFFQNGRAILPILRVAFYKRPSVNIADIGFAISSQQVKPTHLLLKLLNNSIAHEFLGRSKIYRETYLFSFLIPLNNTIKSG